MYINWKEMVPQVCWRTFYKPFREGQKRHERYLTRYLLRGRLESACQVHRVQGDGWQIAIPNEVAIKREVAGAVVFWLLASLSLLRLGTVEVLRRARKKEHQKHLSDTKRDCRGCSNHVAKVFESVLPVVLLPVHIHLYESCWHSSETWQLSVLL